MDVDEDAAGGYELAYTEAVRALADQRGSLEALRTRAGVLLSGAAITSSLLGRQAFGSRVSVAVWLAVISFAALVASLLAIVWPRKERDSTLSPTGIIETYVETDDPPRLALVHRDLTYHMDVAYQENESSYERLALHFRRATVLLGVEVLTLLVHLGTEA